MEGLITKWWFWVGVVLILEGLAIFFLMGKYKYNRFRARQKQDVEILLRQTRNAKPSGHHPCRFDGGVWHQGVCTVVACPPKNNRPKPGALYHAHH